MKTQFLLLLLGGLLLGNFSLVNAQNKSNQLSLSYGFSYNLKFDAVYSRLPRSGFNHAGNLTYNHIHEKRWIAASLDFSTGLLGVNGSRISQLGTYAGALSLKYLFRIAPEKIQLEQLALYVGVSAGLRGEIWFPQRTVLNYGWDINTGLGLAVGLNYQLHEKWTLQYQLDFHGLGIVWRPHNNGQQLITEELQKEQGTLAAAFETPRFAHWGNTIYMTHALKVNYAIHPKIDLYYQFILDYRHINVPLVRKGYDLKHLIGITYKF